MSNQEYEETNDDDCDDERKKTISDAAAILGRLGGLKGGKARAAKLTAKRRRKIAQNAARSRWEKERE